MKETTIAALIAAAEALEEDGEDAFAADLRYFAGARVEPSGRDPVEVIAEMLNTAPFGDIARHCNSFLQGIMQNEALLERLRAKWEAEAQPSRSVDLPQVVSPFA